VIWRLDTQDSLVIPTRGVHSQVRLSHVFDGPDLVVGDETVPYDTTGTQLSVTANGFWSADPRNRLFLYGGIGTSFESAPLPTEHFTLGSPFRLGAYAFGELRGADYYIVTGGYLRQVGRLPDFIGGPLFAVAGERRCVRWMAQRRMAEQRRRRRGDGHDCRPGGARRVVGLRRPLADVHGRRPDVPLGRPCERQRPPIAGARPWQYHRIAMPTITVELDEQRAARPARWARRSTVPKSE
jgi:hypothetical protein